MSVASKLYEARFDSLDVPHKTHATLRLDISIPRPILKGHRSLCIGSDPTRFWRWSYCRPKFQCTRCFPSSPQAQRCPFSPPVVTTNSIFPSVLAQYTTTKPPYLLGNVRIQVRISLQAAQRTPFMCHRKTMFGTDTLPWKRTVINPRALYKFRSIKVELKWNHCLDGPCVRTATECWRQHSSSEYWWVGFACGTGYVHGREWK